MNKPNADAGDLRTAAGAIQVIMSPDYSRAGNPYQRLLAGGVTAAGAPVEFFHTTHAFLPFLRSLPPVGRARRILHLHWVDVLLAGRRRDQRLRWLAQFVLDLNLVRLRGWAIVWTVHNLYSHECPDRWVEGLTLRSLGRIAHQVIVHGRRAQELVTAEFGIPAAKITVIPHGTYVGVYPDTVTREEARRRLNLDPKTPVFLYLGDMRIYKGVDNLCRAFAALNRPDALLVLAGKLCDEVRDEVTAFSQAQPNVRLFPGFMADDQLQVYLRAADYSVVPYRAILTSTSIVLAKSFHTPVISPDLGCVGETLDCPPDVLYDPDDPCGLEQALRKGVQQCERGEWRPSPETGPTWEAAGRQTVEVYQAALRAAGRG
jgi:glycosyltransferase involved in cell wall biosynthesis